MELILKVDVTKVSIVEMICERKRITIQVVVKTKPASDDDETIPLFVLLLLGMLFGFVSINDDPPPIQTT